MWSLLLWTSSIEALYLVQLCYGFFMAAEVAYYTYMYAKVDKEKYQRVTGHARASLLSGRFIASVLAQILVSFDVMNLRDLNKISLGGKIIIFIPRILKIFSWDFPQLNLFRWEFPSVYRRLGSASTCGVTMNLNHLKTVHQLPQLHFPATQSQLTVLRSQRSPGIALGSCCGNISSKHIQTRQFSCGQFSGLSLWVDSYKYKVMFSSCGWKSTLIRTIFITAVSKQP